MNEMWKQGWRAVQTGNVPPWVWVVAAALALLLVWALLRRGRHDPANDRYAPGPLISVPQVDFLHYLQEVFPDEAVLFRPPLDRVLTVRKSDRTDAARARLTGTPLDYVVCGDQGRPRFAFLVDRFQTGDPDQQAARATELNRMLKTAGVRLVRIKGSPHELMLPAQMRARLVNVARAPVSEDASYSATSVQPSAFGPSGFSLSRGPESAFRSTGVEDDPWSSVRKR